MNRKRPNTTATHFHHIDRVHSKRLIELADGICEKVIDLEQVTHAECLAEQRRLTGAVEPLQRELAAAKRENRDADVILIGNSIEGLNRRLGACKLRLKELNVGRSGEGKRCLKAAMREMLSPEQVTAILQRANEIEAESDRQWKGQQ